MTATPSKADLERTKLEAEIALLNQRTEEAALKSYRYAIEVENHQTSQDVRRVYNFMAPVAHGTVIDCIQTLDAWSQRDPGEDITIIMNSPGGSVTEGFALFDFLEELQGRGHHLTMKVRGWAASMGSILLQAVDHRIVGSKADILIHEISSVNVGKLSEMEDEMEFLNRLADRALDIYADRSTLTKTQIKRRWKRKDWWLDAEEAVELGFADEIG
jgi:ATP-dependent protease ClpP protease subunit